MSARPTFYVFLSPLRAPNNRTQLATTDDDDLATRDEQVVKNIGTIRVGFHRAVLGAQSDLPSHIDKKASSQLGGLDLCACILTSR